MQENNGTDMRTPKQIMNGEKLPPANSAVSVFEVWKLVGLLSLEIWVLEDKRREDFRET